MLVTYPVFNLDQNTRTIRTHCRRTSENCTLLNNSLTTIIRAHSHRSRLCAEALKIEDNTEISMNILIHAHTNTHVQCTVQIIVVRLFAVCTVCSGFGSHSAHHRLYALQDVSLNDM